MEPAHQAQDATNLILQLSPSFLAACFVVIILFSIFLHPPGTQSEKQAGKGVPRKQVVVGTVLVILSYVGAPFPE